MCDELYSDLLLEPGYEAGPKIKKITQHSLCREELRIRMRPIFKARAFSTDQIEEALDFFEQWEKIYYKSRKGYVYHRICGGGAVTQGVCRGEEGVLCAICGQLTDYPTPPKFFMG